MSIRVTFWQAILPVKQVRLICDESSGLCMQDDKSLCAAVTICATQVNIQTHTYRQTDSI